MMLDPSSEQRVASFVSQAGEGELQEAATPDSDSSLPQPKSAPKARGMRRAMCMGMRV